MAAITANLLAAAAPPLNPTGTAAAQTGQATQPTSRSGFADVLTAATTPTSTPTTTPPPTATSTTTPPPTATPAVPESPTEQDESADLVAAALAALGLIQQPVPTQLPVTATTTVPTSTAAVTIPTAAPTIPTDGGVPIPTAATTTPITPPTQTTSRSEQLRFETAPAARGTPNTPTVPTPQPTLPTTTPVEPIRPTATAQTSPNLPLVPATTNTSVAAAPSDVIAAAARTPAVVAQVPVVAERSQLLPAAPPELGYSLVGPTIDGPPAVNPVAAVGGTPSQGQVEVRAASLPPVEPPAPPTEIQLPQQTRQFTEVLSDARDRTTAEQVTAQQTRPFTTVLADRVTPTAPASVPSAPAVARPENPQPVETPTAPQPAATQPARPQPTAPQPVHQQPADTEPTSVPTPTAESEPAAASRTVVAEASVPTSRPVVTEVAAPTIQPTDKAPTQTRANAVTAEPSVPTTQPAADGTKTPEANDNFPSQVAVPVPAEPAVAGGSTPTVNPVTAPQIRPAEPTPAEPPRVTSNTPPVAAQVSDAYVSQARVIERGGRHEFQLRLDPPELGEVKVRVLAMGDKVEARLVVSDDAVRKMIESQLPELRQRLEQAGVSVPKFDVTTDGGRANTGGGGWDRPQPPTPTFRQPSPTPATIERPTLTGGLLDVTA